ncbi:putative zinc-binding dehydrogenase [Escherichia coli]|uniref:Putative zinc-binding dehydrogenase n=1 Tax=Escherichia coli TaxID=562 RepID=A0A2X1P8S6_ECOLX|nr:putative zinc-binding dehydrogenase [Escherichia coli]
MSTMKVLICQEIKNLVWTVRERPVPGDNEALIKIKNRRDLRYRYSCLGGQSTIF